MKAERILRNALIIGALSLFSLALLPGTVAAEKAAPGQSMSSASGALPLVAQSVKPDTTLAPLPAPSISTPPEKTGGRTQSTLADPDQDDGEGINDGGVAVKPQAVRKHDGPLGSIGISCEDAKDLQALALGTYGNILKAITNSPGIVNCPPKSDSDSGPAAASKASGKSEGGK